MDARAISPLQPQTYKAVQETIQGTASQKQPFEVAATAQKGLSFASNTSDSVGIVKRFIKSGRKITKAIFPEKSAIVTFMDKHPVVAKIFFTTQIFDFMTLLLAIPKLRKSIKKVIHDKGIQRYDAATKIITTVGKSIGAIATIIAGLEAFKLGAKLGEWGLKHAERAFSASVNLVDLLGIISSILSIASIIHKGFALHLTRKMTKQLKAYSWYRKDGNYSSKEYQLFRQYCQQMSDKEAKALGSELDIDKTALKAALVGQTLAETPSEDDLEKMRRSVNGLMGRLQIRQKLCIVKILTSAVNLITVACIFIPPLEPLAVVLACATGIAKIATKLFDNINQYKLETTLGTIARGDKAPPRSWKAKVVDFAKWEIGWYEQNSRIKRVLNSSLNIGNAVTKPLSTVCDILAATETVLKFVVR